LPVQLLSNLLWAACGVNRKIGPFGIPGRTAASASNSQEIDLYVAVRWFRCSRLRRLVLILRDDGNHKLNGDEHALDCFMAVEDRNGPHRESGLAMPGMWRTANHHNGCSNRECNQRWSGHSAPAASHDARLESWKPDNVRYEYGL
jgi:hypothetical protein